jgi:predicted  nucleic acid-binding Zn-ribbon protein
MPRKRKTEVLPPVRPGVIPDVRATLDELVEEKVAKLMSKDSDALFQPYFQSNRVTQEIRKNQTVSEQQKWRRYFKKYGCDRCGEKKRAHVALGRCYDCYWRTYRRLTEITSEAASEKGSMQVFVDRLGDAAREALRPASPPLPPEKRMDLEWIARDSIRSAQKALPAGKSHKRASKVSLPHGSGLEG